MKIRIQIAGGLGNQLFIWNAAHHLQSRFNSHIELIFIQDENWRSDRKLELESISRHCNHPISILTSKKLGIFIKVLDKFNLEKIPLTRWILQTLGVYNFENPVSELVFRKQRPRLIRSYFQRTNLVDDSWDSWKTEFYKVIEDLEILEIDSDSVFNATHVRRGDSLSLISTFGVIEDSFFENEVNGSSYSYVCTDDFELPEGIQEMIRPTRIFTPKELDAWQTLKVFCEAVSFQGVNSTLSWWACYVRIQSRKYNASLPKPWTRIDLGYEKALHIHGVTYKDAKFVDVE
jgi:hypothetical protein